LVLDAVLENSNALPEFEEDWSKALEESKKYEEEHQDPLEFDAELAAFWHEKKRANLFFRICLDEHQLAALVLDPRTGRSLEIMPPGWVSAPMSAIAAAIGGKADFDVKEIYFRF
jgi:hypothetical protein